MYLTFFRLMKKIRVPTTQRFEINVRRKNLVEDSYHQIMKIQGRKNIDKLRHNLWIVFMGETGQDYGGVARDWFHNLSTELFNPYYGLFEYSANDVYTLQINPDSGICNDQHLELFRFIRRIVGLAVYHQKLLNAFFIRPFYSMMLGYNIHNSDYSGLGKKISLDDMEYVDEVYYNSLVHIRDNDPTDLEMTFQVSYTRLGETVYEDLVEDGENIAVTEENKMEYIDKVIQWRFVSRVKVKFHKHYLDHHFIAEIHYRTRWMLS